MSSQFRSFDEYWSQFLRRSRPLAHGQLSLGRTTLGLARAALVTLAARQPAQRTRRPVELRWAIAATLLSWGKLLAGTFEAELDDALRADAANWPSVEAVGTLEGHTVAGGSSSRRPGSTPPAGNPWAVWM
ncbi:MAG: hypothetical protein IPI67_23695 [Myxococcales bacterium]|nr:hypothetical protein [Myxococcales bacterium]